MRTRTIVLIFFGVVLLLVVLYFWGFIYSFRNFGPPKGSIYITSFIVPQKKEAVELRLHELVRNNSSYYRLADTGTRFTNDGWHTLTIHRPADSLVSVFRFAGDSSYWAQEPDTEILLLSVEDNTNLFTHSGMKKSDKKILDSLLTIFEKQFIDSLRIYTKIATHE